MPCQYDGGEGETGLVRCRARLERSKNKKDNYPRKLPVIRRNKRNLSYGLKGLLSRPCKRAAGEILYSLTSFPLPLLKMLRLG